MAAKIIFCGLYRNVRPARMIAENWFGGCFLLKGEHLIMAALPSVHMLLGCNPALAAVLVLELYRSVLYPEDGPEPLPYLVERPLMV